MNLNPSLPTRACARVGKKENMRLGIIGMGSRGMSILKILIDFKDVVIATVSILTNKT